MTAQQAGWWRVIGGRTELLPDDLTAGLADRLAARRGMRRYGGPSSWEDLIEVADRNYSRAEGAGHLALADRWLAIRDALIERLHR